MTTQTQQTDVSAQQALDGSDEIFTAFGMQNPTQEEKDQFLAMFGEAMWSRILVSILEKLPPEQHESVNQLMQQEGDLDFAGLNAICEAHIPEFGNFFEKVVTDFVQEMKDQINPSTQ